MTITELTPPIIQRVRAYFAPVNRAAEQTTIFDPAQEGAFQLGAPPAPWVDLGWIQGFTRKCGTLITPVRTGSPASTQMQVRSEIEADVQFSFESWGKLQLSLAAGTQQMNLLATQSGGTSAGSGGAALGATALSAGSTASSLNLGVAESSAFLPGMQLAVDVDYMPGQTGFVGSGVSGAYVRSALSDVDYVRRVTLNVARIAAVTTGTVTLERPLIAGAPSSGMKVSAVRGFCDREGSSFFQEWSALFVGEGQQGDRVLWHYPRLQAVVGISEEVTKASGGYSALRLAGRFRALPVSDPVDGEKVLCFRSYIAG